MLLVKYNFHEVTRQMSAILLKQDPDFFLAPNREVLFNFSELASHRSLTELLLRKFPRKLYKESSFLLKMARCLCTVYDLTLN